jgi:hypothetical protein
MLFCSQRYEFIPVHCFTFTQKTFSVTLQSSTIRKAHKPAKVLVIMLWGTVAGYQRRSETCHYLLPASQRDSHVPPKKLMSTRLLCQLRTQHRKSNPNKPQISINVPSSFLTIILHMIILKHYEETGFKISYFTLSSSFLSKNIKIKTHRTIILPVVLYGCEGGK